MTDTLTYVLEIKEHVSANWCLFAVFDTLKEASQHFSVQQKHYTDSKFRIIKKHVVCEIVFNS
jgi:hypothetical protein